MKKILLTLCVLLGTVGAWTQVGSKEIKMATITLNPEIYKEAQAYATANHVSVEEWVSSLVVRFTPAPKKRYKMKAMHELSPELLKYVGFAKPMHDDDDINGDRARERLL